MTKNKLYLVWLEWPEKCFRVDTEALHYLKTLVPASSRIIRARSERAFLRSLPKATHAIVWNFKSEWFARAPLLEVLATPAAGRELVPEQGPDGVRIHFGHYHGAIMAETVAAAVLAWARGYFALEAHRRTGAEDAAWPRTWMSSRCLDVDGTKAVIYGYGNVGRAIGRKLAALGVETVGVTRRELFFGSDARKIDSAALTQALKAADWLILALPSTTGTDGIIDAKVLRKLPRRCVVINVGRGNAIDEQALYQALKTRRIAGACLDVRRVEPTFAIAPSKGESAPLETLDNCVISPHSSAFSPRYVVSCFKELADDGCL